MRIAGLLVIVLLGMGMGCSVALSSGASASSTAASNMPRRGPAQQTSINVQQQPSQSGYNQNAPASNSQSAIRRFAVKNYSKIDADNKKGGGEYLSSLATLMESEGIPKTDALALIKQALRKANGNAETFGAQIEKFVE